MPAGPLGPSGVLNGHHQACAGASNAPCGMKMQAGSACLHCGVAGMHWPLLQKLLGGHVTLAQAVGCAAVWRALQVPSDWQKPSPQSASLLHRPLPVPTLHDSSLRGSQGCAELLSTQAAASTATARKTTLPLPIPHLHPDRMVGIARRPGNPPGGREQELA